MYDVYYSTGGGSMVYGGSIGSTRPPTKINACILEQCGAYIGTNVLPQPVRRPLG